MRTRGIFTILLALSVVLVLAQPATAMKCSQWTRLSDEQKYQAISRMVDDAIAGQRGRQYRVNRNAIGRCLDSQIQNIFYDFDDTCADSRRAGMQALNNIFKGYIWSCAG
jgi:hypothetical protein